MAIRQDLFAHVINQLRRGAAQEELSERLNECVQNARDTGKCDSEIKCGKRIGTQ